MDFSKVSRAIDHMRENMGAAYGLLPNANMRRSMIGHDQRDLPLQSFRHPVSPVFASLV